MHLRNYRAILTLVFSIIFVSQHLFAQKKSKKIISKDEMKKNWVDSVYNKLTRDERIGQLFMVAAYSGGKSYNEDAIIKLISEHQVGGLIFMQGGPARQANLTNEYQHMAQVPLLIAMDAEWGLGMRLDSVQNFPREMMIGATRDTMYAYRMASAIALQCKRLGVHVDFAPVVDVNNNPANPIINSRAFGEDKVWVAKMGIAYMHGLQNNGIMACAKHFPGHGNTSVDSHKDLPVIDKSMGELDTVELFPFKAMIRAGVKSMMVAHLEIPALETEAHVPTTLSKNTVTGLLKDKMGFKGLIFTDALNMQGVAKYFAPGDADLRAFTAGNDVLLFSQDVPVAIGKIKDAMDSGKIPESRLEESVKKILGAKYDAGLSKLQTISTDNIVDDLNKYVLPIREMTAKAAITLVRDENGIINKVNRNMSVGYIGINVNSTPELCTELYNNLGNVISDWLPKGSSADKVSQLLEKIKDYDATIVAVHNISFYPGSCYGLDAQVLSFLQQVQNRDNVMVVLLGNAYACQNFPQPKSLMITYEDDSVTESVVAKVLLKKQKAKGTLPVYPFMTTGAVSISQENAEVKEPVTNNRTLKKVEIPAEAGVKDMDALFKLNMFIQRCIVDGAFPGCRILAARNGKVFYDKSFGYYTYEKKKAVDPNSIYDVASMTKILATTLAVMHLYETGKLDLDATVDKYLKWTKGTNKAKLHIRDLLLHQAGLKSWIPFYKETIDAAGYPNKEIYSETQSKEFNIQVSKSLYMRNDYVDTIWSRILMSPLENTGRFVYSDLDFYFLAEIVEQISKQPLNQYVDEQFYKPMGLKRITYLPLKKFSNAEIVPTELDIFFRHEQVSGFVHDPGAALFGGVAGHAGIFASAGDVAAIFQMLLNKGEYNGVRYFKPETIDYFTVYNSKLSRRGLGFDKPAVDKDDGGPAGDRCTGYAFGHQGFTGTCGWADPGTGVVFVFLSNRVYPSSDNTKINKLNVRTVAQDYIYQSLGLPVNHDRPQLYKKEMEMKEGAK